MPERYCEVYVSYTQRCDKPAHFFIENKGSILWACADCYDKYEEAMRKVKASLAKT